jgi:integrase
VEWGTIAAAPKVKLLRGEHHRERVVTPDEESRYLAVAGELMADIATTLIDTGMRPEENARLRWESVSWGVGQHGALHVTHGKTAAAKRMLPLSPRVRGLLERRWRAAKLPLEGWVWTSGTVSGHIEPSTIKKQHRRALRLSGVRPFVLYSLRHTFLTRLGGAGCDGLDTRSDRGVFINRHVGSLRPSEYGCGDECLRADGSEQVPASCETGYGSVGQERQPLATVFATVGFRSGEWGIRSY